MHKTNDQERFDPAQVKKKVSATLLRAGAISILIIVGVFVGAILLFPLTRFLPDAAGSGDLAQRVDWGLLEGITGLATLCLVIGGLVFAYIEYRRSAIQESRESAQSSFHIYQEMYDKLTDTEATGARRWIILNLPTLEDMGGDRDAWLARTTELLNGRTEGNTEMRPPGQEHLKHILNVFDFIGFVDNHYWTFEEELVEWMNPVVAKVWERVHHYVEAEAERRQEPDYYQAARELGNQCLQWRVDRGWKSVIVKDAT
jgi:hypothetical protein